MLDESIAHVGRLRAAGLFAWLLPWSVALTACSKPPSRDEIKAEYQAFVADRGACSATAECVLVQPECPLGCNTPVNEEHAEAVKAKARDLIADYESGGETCDYKCPLRQVECQEGRCEAVPVPEGQ